MRGSYHIHGCMRLKDDPGISELAQEVISGRKAHRELKLRNIQPNDDQKYFSDEDIQFDTHYEDEVAEPGTETSEPAEPRNLIGLSPEDIARLFEKVKVGIEAQEKIIAFQDFFRHKVY